MQEFQITLKNEKVKLYNQLSWLILIINFLIFVYFSFALSDKEDRSSGIATSSIVFILFLYMFFSKKLNNQSWVMICFYIFMAGWIIQHNYWMAALIGVLSVLHGISQIPPTVFVDKEKIQYPSLLSKIISWSELNNCLLKDGLLTIDFKNNKIIQQLIDPSKTSVNEQEFNDFCRAQLNQ